MLSSVATLIGLSAVVIKVDAINVNDVDAKYFIGLFNTNEFPLSVDTCNPRDILGASGSQMVVCNDESTATLTYYTGGTCSTATLQTTEVYNSSYQTGSGTLYDFNCDDDATDAYVEIEFALSCDTETTVTMYAALASCAYLSDSGLAIQVYCKPDYAEMDYFLAVTNETLCDADLVYDIANATDECGFMLETSDTDIFGTVIDCVGSGLTRAPTGAPTADSNTNCVFRFISFGIVIFFTALKI